MSNGPAIIGTEDADFLQGTEFSEEIYGLGGDDIIDGGDGDDEIDGGEGADHLTGGAGNDVYVVDESDTVVELDDGGDDEVRTSAAVYALADYVERLTGLSEDGQELIGNSLDNIILGDSGGDVLRGGLGNDSLTGGGGSDIYVFWRGEGEDLISVAPNSGHDSLQLLDISMSNVTVSQSGYDLILTVDEGGGSITLLGSGSSFTSLAGIIFADGTWSNEDLLAYSTAAAGDGPDILTGDDNDNVILGLGGDDVLDGVGGDDTLDGGDGDDILKGGSGVDTIEGGAGNDRLTGNAGSDIYRFSGGFGQDVIAESDSSGGGGYDRIDLLDILPSGVTVTADAETDLIISINGTTDSIRIENGLFDPLATIDHVSFADGTTWSGQYLVDLVSPPPFHGTDEDEVVVGGNLTDRLYGGGGDDSLSGGRWRDVLIGGRGNDFLSGGEGDDFYSYRPGDGNDVIQEYAGSGDGGYDVLDIIGYWSSNTTVGRSADGFSYILYFDAGEESITLYGAAAGNPENRVDEIWFEDGGLMNDASLAALARDIGNGDDVVTGSTGSYEYVRGLGGNDVITGGDLWDWLKGDAGDDMLLGGGGEDRLEGGAGDDELNGGDGNDRLEGGAGADILAGGTGDDAYHVYDSSDSIVEAAGEGDDVVFSTAATYTLPDNVEQLFGMLATGQVLIGSALDNQISARWGNDILEGGAGNDLLSGGGGEDVYRFARGDGDDIVSDSGMSWGVNAIEFASGILPGNVSVTHVGSDFVLTVDGGGGSITLSYAAYSDVAEVRFEDGTVWAAGELFERSLIGTDGDDSLTGDYRDNVLLGLGGDDILDGGYGNDELHGGAGSDLLVGGWGDDVYVADELDSIVENPGEGEDEVRTSAAVYLLADNVERLTGLSEDGQELTGNTLDNVILGGSGSDILRGGLGNDHLAGNAGSDRYLYSRGDGHESILVEAGPERDSLLFDFDIFPWEVTVTQSGWDIVLTLDQGGGTVTLLGTGSSFTNLSDVTFGDLSAWGNEELLARSMTTTEESDSIRGDFRDNALSGLGGNDILDGAAGNDSLDGGEGDDILSGGSGDDAIEGGSGSDVLAGGEGNDVFRFAPGFGQDVITLAEGAAAGGYDRIEFLGAILPGDVTATVDGADVLVTISGTTDQIRLKDIMADPAAMIDEFAFADGTVTYLAALLGPQYRTATAGNDILIGTPGSDMLFGEAGDDALYGGANEDYLDGGTGNDLLAGGDGNDYYFFPWVFGHDVVHDEGGFDEVYISADMGLYLSDIHVGVSADGFSYILYFDDGENSITFYGAASGDPRYRIESIQFATGGLTTGGMAARVEDISNGDDDRTGTDSFDRLRGLFGNDVIDGAAGDDWLRGDAGDDTLIGGEGEDTLDGGTGADVLNGGAGHDSLNGGLGADQMSGGAGDDVYVVDETGDVIVEAAGEGNDEVRATATTYTLSAGLEKLIGESGDGQVLIGNASDNLIQGSWGDDVLEGGAGNDYLTGNSGADVYRFARGDGDDVVSDWDQGSVIQFAPGILPEDVRVTMDGGHAILTVDEGGGSVTFQYAAYSYGLLVAKFDDGTLWTYDEILARSMIGTEEADVLRGDHGDNVLRGLGGDDILSGLWGNDTLEGGAGDDLISGEWGEDILDGGAGDDSLSGMWGSDILDGGAGDDSLSGDWDDDLLKGGEGNDSLSGMWGNDIMEGGPGNDWLSGQWDDDIYRFARGDGDDSVDGGDYGTNAIEFAAGILPEDVELTLSGRDIVLTLDDDGGSIRIIHVTDYWGAIDVRFEDGTVWSSDYMLGLLLTGSDEADVLMGFYRDNTLKGLGGDDILRGLFLGDILEGGTGNDVLIGDSGDDVYRFGPGFGDDMIRESASWGGFDRIEFMAGILPTGVAVWTADGGRDLVLSITGTTDRIRLDNAIVDGMLTVEEVLFADGTVWTAADLLAFAVLAPVIDNEHFGTAAGDTLVGGASSDILHGGAGDDAIDGGAGNDHLEGGLDSDVLNGGAGNDFYYYQAGDGHDVIRDWAGAGSGGHDTLQLGAGLQSWDVTVGRSADGLGYVLYFGGGEGSVTLDGGAAGASGHGIESIRFDDGGSISVADLELLATDVTNGDDVLTVRGRRFVRGLGGNDVIDASAGWEARLKGDAGDDILIGGNYEDQLEGGAGSDVLTGGGGDDEYIVDALDTIVELAGGGVDTVSTNVALYVLGEHLEHLVGNSAGAQELVGNDVGNTIVGGSGDDVLRGGLGNDYLMGRAGADLLIGGAGDDFYRIDADDASDSIVEADGEGLDQVYTNLAVYLLPDHVEGLSGGWDGIAQALTGNALDNTIYGGSGDDLLKGGLGDDLLDGGYGSDTYLFSRGDGDDYISANSPWNYGSDTLQFGPDILPGDVTVTQSGFEIVITVDQGGGSVTLRCDFFLFTEVSQVIFGDGTIWSRDELVARSMVGTDSGQWLVGNPSDNLLMGLGGDDVLRGGAGNDLLNGGDGNDILQGESGTDQLTGGAGADRFQLYDGDTSTGSAADRITDFVAGEDQIAISLYAYGSFSFVGSTAFSGTAGEVRYWFDGTDTWVQVDAYGWGSATAEIVLSGEVIPTASDFLF
jgi:trimeric autotransporter adhesin